MRRTYDETYLTRNPKAVLSRFAKSCVKNRRKLAAALVFAIIALFVISCLVTASSTTALPAVAQTVREVAGAPGPAPSAPGLYASAAALVEADNGRLLYEKNGHVKLPIASTTKMVTALVVRDKLGLKDNVTISPEAAATGEQAIGLQAGETLTVEQLLYALLLQSANDSAVALAQAAGGSVNGFAELMDAKAQELGAKDSNFTNPDGLDQQGNYSTACDLAVIGRRLMSDPVLAKIVQTNRYDIPDPTHPWSRVCLNHNEILSRYPGATGVKTGYTAKAGQCLVASATRDGKALVAVALNSQQRASDCAALFNYGFNLTAPVMLVKKDATLGGTRVSSFPKRVVDAVPANGINALSVKGAGDVYTVRTDFVTKTARSVKKGQRLGKIVYTLNGKPAGSEDVVASASVYRPGPIQGGAVFLWYSLCRMGRMLSSPFRF